MLEVESKSNRVHSLAGMAAIASLPEAPLVLSGFVGSVLSKYTDMNIVHITCASHNINKWP